MGEGLARVQGQNLPRNAELDPRGSRTAVQIGIVARDRDYA